MSAVLENALLQRGLKIEVYPFGISSASASHYLAIMRYVRARFSPDLYIVNIVHNDIQDSLAATTGDRAIYFGVRQSGDSFEEVPPKIYQPSLLRRIIGHWAIARYLYVNLGLMWKLQRQNQPRQFEANIDVTKMMGTQEGRQLTKYIFAKYLDEVENDRKKLVLLMDTVREPIYEGVHPNTTAAFQYNEVIGETCQELSLYCLDLTDYFWADFQRNKRRFNSVIDGHWNKYGHKVVAEAVERYLLKNALLSSK